MPHSGLEKTLHILSEFPPTGAGAIVGRLGASNAGSHVPLLLNLGLEVGTRVGPHIGGVNINEGMGGISW